MKNTPMLTILAFMVILLAGTARAMAEPDAGATNSNTGEGSVNKSETVIENTYKEVNNSEGTLNNSVTIKMDSGQNEASENPGEADPAMPNDSDQEGGRGGGSIQTGDATFDVEITNKVNTNSSQVALNEEPEEGGKGGGPGDQPVVTTPAVQLTAAGTPTTLPSAGPDFFNQMVAMIGLPLLGTMAMAAIEMNKRKKLAVKI